VGQDCESTPRLPVVLFDSDGWCYVLATVEATTRWVEPLTAEEAVAAYDGLGRPLELTWNPAEGRRGGPVYQLMSLTPDLRGLKAHSRRFAQLLGSDVDVSQVSVTGLIATLRALTSRGDGKISGWFGGRR
jgi:hypothetical protein